MVKSKITALMLMILIGLTFSCSHVAQKDHDNPIKPHHKKHDTQLVHRITRANKPWFQVSSPVKQINK